MTQNSDIGAIVRQAEQDWTAGNVQVSKYVTQNFYEDINTIEAYLNSKHISGPTDEMKREKPFFNIVLAARNIWFRATDLDRKNIRGKAMKEKDQLASFLYTAHVQKWMKDTRFGRFLNDWGLYLASYNSAVVKFVENSDGLHASVMDWNKMIVDVIDFDANPKIEVLELTPAQLRRRKGYDKEMVKKLIEAQSSRTTPEGQTKDLKNNYIKLYEVHGELPLSYLTGERKDEETYVQQMQVVSFMANKETGKFDDYVLIKGREKQDPYMLTWLIPSVDGSISLMGSVKTLFDAQWMNNHTAKNQKDILDFISKLVLQTNDPNFANKNVLDNIEMGQIMVYAKDANPLTVVNNSNSSYAVTALQNFGMQWKNLAQELTSTPDVLQGKDMPSGTAWRLGGLVQQEAHSNFEVMTENKALHLEEMFRRYITPYLLKKMDTTDEIVATLDAYGIDKIDERYIANEAVDRFNRKAVEAVLNDDELPSLEQERLGVEQEMAGEDSRFIRPSKIPTKTWKEVMKDFEGEITYEITNENTDKQATMDTLSTVFQTLATPGGQAAIQTPDGKFVFNKILEETGRISPVELKNKPAMPMAQPPQVGAGVEAELMKQPQ